MQRRPVADQSRDRPVAQLEEPREPVQIVYHKVQEHQPGCSCNAWVDQAVRQALLDERARQAARKQAQRSRRAQ